MADISYELREYEKAVELCNKVSVLDPDYTFIHFEYINHYEGLRDESKIKEHLNRLKDIFGNNEDVEEYILVSEAKLYDVKEDAEGLYKAVNNIKTYLEHNERDFARINYHKYLGRYYEFIGEKEKAKESYLDLLDYNYLLLKSANMQDAINRLNLNVDKYEKLLFEDKEKRYNSTLLTYDF